MVKKTDISTVTLSNRLAWDATAIEHAQNADWDQLIAGFSNPEFSTFDSTITKVLKDLPIKGQSVVQIGCNNGREILSAISLGASAGFGIDQSNNFIEQAKELTLISGKECNFLTADIYDLPISTPRDFDVALITIGVLNWMPDLVAFFNEIAGLLHSSGKLVIYETHPFLEMFDPDAADPHALNVSYFTDEPYVSEETFVYGDGKPSKAPTSYWFPHRLGEIVNACIQAGLVIDSLVEYPHSNREAEFDVYTNQAAQLPMCFTLTAHKIENNDIGK